MIKEISDICLNAIQFMYVIKGSSLIWSRLPVYITVCLYFKVYEVDPYILTVCKEMQEYLDLYESKLQVKFTPAESDTAMMGGNSNWRGPIWLCSKYNNVMFFCYS